MSLLVVGSVAFDAIETPFGKTDKIIGGAATYISLAASYFRNQVKLVAVVGGDFPKEDIAMLERHNVDTEGLQVRENEKSFFWSGRYGNDMNSRDTLVTELNVLADFDPIIPESYQSCEYVMLGNLAPQVQGQVLDRLRTRPKFIVMDTMNFWMDIALEDLKKTIARVDCLCINDEEARQLSGQHSLRKAAKAILAMGPTYLVIKKGEHGALLFSTEGGIFSCPALPLEDVYDPTGAGDTFAGGFIGYIASSGEVSFESLKRGIVFGSALASLCVEKFGPERLIDVDWSEFQARVKQFAEITRFDTTMPL